MTIASDLAANAATLDANIATLVSEHEAGRINYSVSSTATIAYMRTLINQARTKAPGVANQLDVQLTALDTAFKTMRDRQIAAVTAWDSVKTTLYAARDALHASVAALEATPAGVCGFDESLVDYDAPAITAAATVNGTEYENRVIHGKWSVQAQDIHVKNCDVLGMFPVTSGGSVIDASSLSATRFHIEDTRITVPTPDVKWSEGLRLGADAVAVRVTVQHTVDGFAWHNKLNSSATVQPTMVECQAYDLTWFAVDPNQVDGSHNDGLQIHSPIGAGAKIIDCLLDAGVQGTASIMANVTACSGLWVVGTTLRGGRSGINFGPTPTPTAYICHNDFSNSLANVYAASAVNIVARGNTPSNTITPS